MSLNQITSAIMNNIVQGLKGVTNISIPQGQVEHEVILAVNSYIKEVSPFELQHYYQKIKCLKLECKDISDCCDIKSGQTVLWTEIPKLTILNNGKPIRFAGSIDYKRPFHVYYDIQDANKHKYNLVTKTEPYIWVDLSLNSNGRHSVWLFNVKLIKHITLEAIVANPLDISEYSCCVLNEETPFPAPEAVIDAIIKKISIDYINYYKRAQPNQIVVPNNNTYTS